MQYLNLELGFHLHPNILAWNLKISDYTEWTKTLYSKHKRHVGGEGTLNRKASNVASLNLQVKANADSRLHCLFRHDAQLHPDSRIHRFVKFRNVVSWFFSGKLLEALTSEIRNLSIPSWIIYKGNFFCSSSLICTDIDEKPRMGYDSAESTHVAFTTVPKNQIKLVQNCFCL